MRYYTYMMFKFINKFIKYYIGIILYVWDVNFHYYNKK